MKWPRGRALVLVGIASAALYATADGGTASAPKPTIGVPKASPAAPVAGKRFIVTFRVTRGGATLSAAKIATEVSVAGTPVPHTRSFSNGSARVSLVVPLAAAGKQLRVKVTITASDRSATRTTSYSVAGGKASISVGDASTAEGNAGQSALSFVVRLAAPATQVVSVAYATSDGSATAPDDYTPASGTLTFQPGEKTKSIVVPVIGDLSMEGDETLTLTLSNPVNAVLARGSSTGTITNDDTAVPVTAGGYKGATQNGNYVFFTLRPDRTISEFRINDLPAECDPYGTLTGGENFGRAVFAIKADGTVNAESTWRGSDPQGDIEWTYAYVKLNARFDTPTTASGTILVNYELNYSGRHYTCSSGNVSWTASLQ